MSIDPFTGRNPSYCFVDFYSADDGQQALTTMQGQDVRGRPVRLSYHTQKKFAQARRDSRYVFNSWSRSEESPSRWIQPHREGRRLYVGGLPPILSRPMLNELMRDLFRDYPIEAVSKIIWPHPSTWNKPGEHYYCFVDLPTAEMAEQAAQSLDDTEGPHRGRYRISLATHSSPSKVIREQFGGVYPGQDSEIQPRPARNLEGNWRSLEKTLTNEIVSAASSEVY